MGKIIRAVGGDDLIKISVIEARDVVRRALEIHGLSATASAALGRTLCAVSMMGNMMKEDNAAVTVRINGGGPIGSILAVTDCAGNVRGYVTNPKADLPLRASDGKLDVRGVVGSDGMLTVIKDIGLREPYVGSTQLVSGEIADDFTAYYAESEQIGAACGLGVLVDTDLSIKAAGGFIVQLLPGAPDELITRLEDNITMMDQLTTVLDEDGVEEVINQVMKGLSPRILSEETVEYRCYCSRERVKDALMTIGGQELGVMAQSSENIEIGCQFCDEVYAFTPAEIGEIVKELNEKKDS